MLMRILAVIVFLIFSGVSGLTPAWSNIISFNAATPAENGSTRGDWIETIGGSPEFLVNFETGFADGQNISDVDGLFPAGLVIRDTSASGQAIVRSGVGVINGSNPVGTFSVTHNEQPFLVLDFSANPVSYVGLLDIDQAGTNVIVTFVDNTTTNFLLETTGSGGDSAEFFAIWRNDMPLIKMVALDASGDGLWGIDNIEYGGLGVTPPPPPPTGVPEPTTLLLLGCGLVGLLGFRRRF